MKKFFFFTFLCLLLSVDASAQGRKTWDFTKGFSGTTIANLVADEANWTYQESGTKKWAESKARTAETEITCMVNGQSWTLPETQGLIFSAKSAKHLNVVYAEGSDDTHIWLNGAKGEDAVTIPDVPAGEKLTVTFSSHGGKDDRGFKVSTSGVADAEGKTQFLSAGQMTVELINNNSESVNVKLSATGGGMHFYKFVIGEGDEELASKVAYLYDGTPDNVLAALQASEQYTVTPVNVTTETVTAEGLQAYDVTVIAASVPADNAVVAVVKDALPWTPFLNMNSGLYPAWGYGEAVAASEFVLMKSPKNSLFNGLTEDDKVVEEIGALLPVSEGEDAITGVKLGAYFADDAVPGVDFADETIALIHTHNITHNGYVFIPAASQYPSGLQKVLVNAIDELIKSKASISAASAPKMKLEYKDLNTNVIITAPNLPKAEVYYTTDGSTPSVSSLKYTGPVNVTSETVFKAVAIAEGYTLSDVAEITADIKSQPKTPVISYEQNEGNTVVTLSCETPDVDIWYNFENEATTDTLKSTKYAEPFTITMPQYVNVFAVAGQAVWSEVATQRVLVKNPRVVIDVVAHFEAKQWTVDNNAAGLAVANGKGMFSWGASAASMYNGEGTKETVTDPETGDQVERIVYNTEDMREPEIVNEPGENPEWKLKSYGTCLIWQNITAQTANFGDNSNYNPIYSTDVDPLFPVTKYDIQFYKFFEGQEPNASIETIGKYKAPIDVVVLANMQGGPLLVQVSADGQQWTTIGEIEKTGMSRMWSKYTQSYDGTDEVFVRVTEEVASSGPKVFDIYIANQGEQSQALLQQLNEELTGIADVRKPAATAAGIFSLSGVRLNGLQRGVNVVVSADGTAKKVMIQ